MQSSPMRRAVRHVAGAALAGGAGPSDRQLLERFAGERDEAAFAALVSRHGPMVLGVCRRVLGHDHDADDAFQATFLVLARKAGRHGFRDSLGNWLYGVAYRTALKARTANSRRRKHEAVVGRAVPPGSDAADVADWRPLLDRELSRLPDKYRVPVVLCELQGVPRREAARRLDLPEGTLSSRLAAARKILADRLARHGLAVTAATLAAGLTRANAAPPTNLVTKAAALATGHTAPAGVAALAEGVLLSMSWTKYQFAAVLTAACLLGAGAGLTVRPATAADTKKPAPAADAKKPDADKKKPDAAKPDGNKKKAEEPGTFVRGQVVAADAGKKTLTLRVFVAADRKETEEKTFAVAGDVKVHLDDPLVKGQPPTPGKFSDLSEGTSVAAKLSEDKKSIAEVFARGPAVGGRVKSVDATRNAITFTTKSKAKGEASEETVVLAKDAKVVLDDGLGKKGDPVKEGKLSDLAEGVGVALQLSVDRKSALSVRIQGASYQGTVKGYDAGSRTLTISVKEDGGPVDKTFTLAEGAKIDGGLNPGDHVNVRTSATDKTTAVAAQSRKDKGSDKEDE